MKNHFFFIGAIFALSACQNNDIQVYRVAKEAPAANGPIHRAAGEPPHADGPANLHWETPAHWQEHPAGEMRTASYRSAGEAGEADISVVVLPGSAGGDLANVNRWRGQIGLEPIDEQTLNKESLWVKTRAGNIRLVDYAGRGSPKPRLMAGILSAGERTWFFKMTGEEPAVASAKPSFIQFLESLHGAH